MENTQETVALKWYKNGIVIYSDKKLEYDVFQKAVEEKFEKSKTFFNGSKMKVGFQGHQRSVEEYKQIIHHISEKFHCKFELWDHPELPERATEEKMKSAFAKTDVISKALELEADENLTKFYKKTIRSGQLLKSDGHLVVLGDVNPGAELEAVGNIMVMGTIKGIVHAGSKGDRDAVVVALNLSPTQLRIADIITRAPDDDSKTDLNPEVAYIKDGQIFIEEFLQKKK